MEKYHTLSRNIFFALILGLLVGWLFPQIVPYVSVLGLTFKLALGMIVMPIVVTSLIAGLESIGDCSKLSGFGLRTLAYFLSTTFIAIVIGLLLVTLVRPGVERPSSELEAIIVNATAADSEQLIDAISQKVASYLKHPAPSQIYSDLHDRLTTLNQDNSDPNSIKQGALNLVGSLELRTHLSHAENPAPKETMSLSGFLVEQIKKSLVNPFEAMAKNNVLAVILFALLFGGALTTIGPLGKKFFELNRAANLAVSKIVDLFMTFAPLGVFGLIADVSAQAGWEIFSKLGVYALCVVAGLSAHLFIVLPIISYLSTRRNPIDFYRAMRPALAIAFSTSSSSAALPVTIQCVENGLGVNKKVSRFVLPLGATINMNGTALYEAVAAVFIAQLYGHSLTLASQITVAITAALAAIGAAGIPAAGTVTMAMVLTSVGLPIEGIGLLLAIDRPLDMCRTAVNVAGDAIGCLVLNKYTPREEEALGEEAIYQPLV